MDSDLIKSSMVPSDYKKCNCHFKLHLYLENPFHCQKLICQISAINNFRNDSYKSVEKTSELFSSMRMDIVIEFSAVLTKLRRLEFVVRGQKRKIRAIGTIDCKPASLVFC